MTTIPFARRSLVKVGIALGIAALAGIRLTSKAVAAVSELKSEMQRRLDGVYKADKVFVARASQDNAQVQELYKNFLTEPGSHRSHELLHMHFTDRSAVYRKLLSEGKLENPGANEFPDPTYPYEWLRGAGG
jgi:site-specific recombinase